MPEQKKVTELKCLSSQLLIPQMAPKQVQAVKRNDSA